MDEDTLLLPSHSFQIAYSGSDDPLHNFYIPALERSIKVIRGTGFYSSSSLTVAAAGVSRLVYNDGSMEVFCGAQLSREDVEAIRHGESFQAVVSSSMSAALESDLDSYTERRLEVLAWLISQGRLVFHVVLPVSEDGLPLAASQSHEYYHPKQGYFLDRAGNSMCFSGSVNESATGWTQNYESFLVHTSWDRPETPAGRAYIRNIQQEFDNLRSGRKPDWIVLPIPEAAMKKLLKFVPSSRPPRKDPVENQEETTSPLQQQIERDLGTKLAFLRDAPRMPGSLWMGAATCTVKPWPHQRKIYAKAVEGYPRSYMFCDEVGLGKTIEAGLVLRQLLISESVKRFLLLVPRAVQRQWQEELWEKFSLNVPLYANGEVRDCFKNKLDWDREKTAWESFDWLLATSHLAKRTERREEVISAPAWDLVIVDEAHHARRKDFLDTTAYRPNSLLTLLLGDGEKGGLVDCTKCIYLMTATPMQVNPIEVWDLLRVLGMGGIWGATKENFLRFFSQLARPFDERDWSFLIHMVRDSVSAGYGPDEALLSQAKMGLGTVSWEHLQHLVLEGEITHRVLDLRPEECAILEKFVRSATPVRGMIFRNTRNLLHEYRRKGLLDQNVPHREPQNIWIQLLDTPECPERDLYERIEQYISYFYKKYEQKRKGLGFIMTVYRKRLTSSFYSLERSLSRRLDFLRNKLSVEEMLDDEDFESEDLDFDVEEEIDASSIEEEIEFVEGFLRDLAHLPRDSKLDCLLAQIEEFLSLRDSLLVFTQYTDTMDFLRDKLRLKYGSRVACYSGRGGERWTGSEWQIVPKELIKNLFRAGEELSILLCTESASEGLNLQTCGILINYDMPWNPMRVEQRIGRIDRIGQTFEKVWVRNFFYEDTVEARVYQKLDERIASFTNVVGRLQPILHDVANVIREASMAVDSEREYILKTRLDELQKKIDEETLKDFDLDSLVDNSTDAGSITDVPADLDDLETLLTSHPISGVGFEPGDMDGEWKLHIDQDEYSITFKPDLFDEFPNSLQLLTWGNPLLTRIFHSASKGDKEGNKGLLSIASRGCISWYDSQIGRVRNIESIQPSSYQNLWTMEQIRETQEAFQAFLRTRIASIGRLQEASLDWQKRALEAEAKPMLIDAIVYQCFLESQLSFQMKQFSRGDILRTETNLVNFGYPWKPLRNRIVGQIGEEDFSEILTKLDSLKDTRRPIRADFEKLRAKAKKLIENYSRLRVEGHEQTGTLVDKAEEAKTDLHFFF